MNEITLPTRAEKLAEDIAEAIFAGEFPPGARLDEHGLAERYRVSRTPVREALRHLGAQGLVETRPRRGAIVVEATPRQIEQMFVAMAEIEASCARLAALSMTPMERRRLHHLQDEMGMLVGANAQASYAEANTMFHSAIYAGTRNPVMEDIAIGLRRRLAPYRRAQFRAPGRLPRSHAEHAAVVDAVVNGDAARAHAAMLDHVNSVESALGQLNEARTSLI